MGAYDFTTYVGGSDAAAAFRRAVDDVAWEHGHGGYTGTIAEKHEYVLIQSAPLPAASARAMAERLIEDDDPRVSDKWGPAGAIPVAGDNGMLKGWLFFGWASS